MKIKFSNAICHILTIAMLAQPIAYATEADAAAEQATFSAEQIEAMKQSLTGDDSAEEILGGKIINKADPSEQIAVACVTSDAQRSCLTAQFIHKSGFAATALTPAIPMKDLVALKAKIKDAIAKALDEYVKNNMREPIHVDVVAITKYIAGKDGVWGDSAAAGLVTGLIGGLIFGLIGIAGGWFVLGGAIVAGTTWPVLTDIVIMPAKLAAAGISRIFTAIHNARYKRKAKRAIKHIQAAINVTMEDGNKALTLSQEDFTALTNVLSGQPSGANTDSNKPELK